MRGISAVTRYGAYRAIVEWVQVNPTADKVTGLNTRVAKVQSTATNDVSTAAASLSGILGADGSLQSETASVPVFETGQ